jgi:two-component system, OmpR family, alkaline phosphatase synthesis response regulator PhoP
MTIPPAAAESRKVLLAEDDPVTARLVIHRLSREPGLTVLHAPDGGTAVTLAERDDLAAAILDIRLPVVDGLTILSKIRKDPRHKKLPVILLTSLGSEADIVRGFELGADDYIVKPFSPQELVARLQRLIARR